MTLLKSLERLRNALRCAFEQTEISDAAFLVLLSTEPTCFMLFETHFAWTHHFPSHPVGVDEL